MNQLTLEHIHDSGQHLQLIQGDITQEKVYAIVNAANAYLQHGAGAFTLNGVQRQFQQSPRIEFENKYIGPF
jgi:hypothetical protein